MANEDKNIPAAPKHLPEDVQKQWQTEYEKALGAAKNDTTDVKAQQRAATKAANRLLSVPEPKSAADIDKLEEWQVLKRETRSQKVGPQLRVCVTADGRKYSFPIEEPKPAKASKAASQPASQSAQ